MKEIPDVVAMKHNDPKSFVPLKPQVFELLLTLADGSRHGYAIMQEVDERTAGRVRLLPGTLYRFLHRLVGEGLLVELPDRGEGDPGDRRRRVYELTAAGREVVRLESERLQATVEVARSKRVLEESGA